MPAFQYVDRHPTWTKDTDWYTSTNETVDGLLKATSSLLAEGKDHIASICSGGDVPVMMLPFTKVSMHVVDHAKKSMVWAMLKVLLLEQFGAERTKALLTGSWQDFDAAAKPLLSLLPGDIAACYYDASHMSYDKGWSGIQHVWKQMPQADLAAAVHHINKMTFIHGDFNLDLTPPEGGYDAMYLSNMHGHVGRENHRPNWTTTLNMAKSGAPLIGAVTYMHGVKPIGHYCAVIKH